LSAGSGAAAGAGETAPLVGDGSAIAGAGSAAGFVRAGVDGFDECQKQPMDAPAITVRAIARTVITMAREHQSCQGTRPTSH
jgi:hypothetical protein